MDKNLIIGIVLVALVFVAGVQAFQLYTLKSRMAEGSVSFNTNAQAGSSPSLPSNLQNLPSMVGGC